MTEPDSRPLEGVDRAGRAAAAAVVREFTAVPPFEATASNRGRSRTALLAVAALVVAVAVGAAVVAVVATDDELPVATDDAGPLAPLAPTYLPEGFELTAVVPPGQDGPPGLDVQPGRVDSYGLVRGVAGESNDGDLVHMQITQAEGPLPDDAGDRVALDDGIDAVLWESSDRYQLMWVADDTMVTLASYHLDRDDLVALAGDIAGEEAGAAPEGWRSVPYRDFSRGVVHFTDRDGGVLSLRLSFDLDLLSFLIAWERSECERTADPCPDLSTVDVRGEEGRLVGHVHPSPHLVVAWTDRTGWAVVLEGNLSEGELLRVAESLEPTTWDELLAQVYELDHGSAPGEFDEPTPETNAAVQGLVGSSDLQIRPVLDVAELEPDYSSFPLRTLGLDPDQPARLLGADPRQRYELGASVLDGTGLTRAELLRAESIGSWLVSLELDDSVHDAMGSVAETCVERAHECPTGQMAVVWEGRVLSAPVVQVPGGVESIAITLDGSGIELLHGEP